jgi:hypothetical protein
MNELNTNFLLESILNTEYVIYSYITADHEPGTIIVDSKLRNVFDEQKLFEMQTVSSNNIKLKDIIEKGFISVGSVDIMDTVNITYPHKYITDRTKEKPTIKGTYLHGSRRELIGETTGIDFEYDPPSELENENEYVDFDDFDNLNQSANNDKDNALNTNNDTNNELTVSCINQSKNSNEPNFDWLRDLND